MRKILGMLAGGLIALGLSSITKAQPDSPEQACMNKMVEQNWQSNQSADALSYAIADRCSELIKPVDCGSMHPTGCEALQLQNLDSMRKLLQKYSYQLIVALRRG